MRRPVSAKKIALISSDLPRENSATKATTSFSLPRRSRKARICSAASPWARSCSERKRASASRRSPRAARQPPRASRLVANEGVIERRRGSSHGSARVHESAVTKRFLGPRAAGVSHSRRRHGCRSLSSAPVHGGDRGARGEPRRIARTSLPRAPARSAALAHRTEERRSRSLDDAPDRRRAAHARHAGAPVDLRIELERARRAVGVAEIAQGRAAELDGAGERRSNRSREPRGARAADSIAAQCAGRFRPRTAPRTHRCCRRRRRSRRRGAPS